MRRRDFITFLGGAMTAARALHAEQRAMAVIGYITSGSPGPSASNVAAFRQGLSETGYVEGKMSPSNIAGPREAMIDCPLWRPTSSILRSTRT
jgi:hypothetical protein